MVATWLVLTIKVLHTVNKVQQLLTLASSMIMQSKAHKVQVLDQLLVELLIPWQLAQDANKKAGNSLF
jgi:hypothetical protein